jgi:hypothetical protein
MVKTINELAMPAFDVCRTKESLSARLLERREMTWVPDWAVDIALWVGNKAAAEALILMELKSSPDLAARFIEYFRIEASAPSLSRPNDGTHCLAWVARKHRLQVLSAA